MEALRSTWTDSRLDDLNDNVGGLGDRVGQVEVRLGQVEVRLEKVEVRVEKVEVRLGQVEVRLGQVEVRLEKVEDRVDELGRRMEAGFASLGSDVRALAAEFHGFQRTMFNIGGGLIGTLAVGILGVVATQL